MSTRKTAVAALCLMLLPIAPAFPQAEVNPDHFPDAADAQVVQLRSDLLEPQAYSSELQAQEDQVEEARQAAISAGMQGDGAAMYIDEYRDQANQLEQLRAKLGSSSDRTEQAQVSAEELNAQENRVEEARQEAISAGIQGDGAGTYIDAYRDQLAELNQLKAQLNPATKSVERASAVFVRR